MRTTSKPLDTKHWDLGLVNGDKVEVYRVPVCRDKDLRIPLFQDEKSTGRWQTKMLVNLGPNDMVVRFDNGGCAALRAGEVVFNNGYRRANEMFCPRQPESIRPRGTARGELAMLGIAVGAAVVSEIAIPLAKKLALEKIYPLISDFVDKKSDEKIDCAGAAGNVDAPDSGESGVRPLVVDVSRQIREAV